MKLRFLPLTGVLVAACATAGANPEFSATGTGLVSAGVACVTDELQEDGWTVSAASPAGLVRADMGTHWLEATLLADRTLTTVYQLEIRTSGSETARDAAAEVMTECSTGP